MEPFFTESDLEQMKEFVKSFSDDATFEANLEDHLKESGQTAKFLGAYYSGILKLDAVANETENQTIIEYRKYLTKVVNYLQNKVEAPPEVNNEFLELMSKAPDSQLDKTMTDRIKGLVGKSAEEVKIGLKYVLDASVYGSLASGVVIKMIDHEWRRLGGTLSDPRTFMPDGK